MMSDPTIPQETWDRYYARCREFTAKTGKNPGIGVTCLSCLGTGECTCTPNVDVAMTEWFDRNGWDEECAQNVPNERYAEVS
jgi:hypothetical protein